MSNAKHTPGPWHLARHQKDRADFRCPPCVFHAETDETICLLGDTTRNFDNYSANAQLIAASPDLLKDGWDLSTYAAASKERNTPEFMEGLIERIEKFQATAAKARGAA